MATYREDNDVSDFANERRIVLIGKTGTGKSCTGNTILGKKAFKSDISGSSITDQCYRHSTSRFGKRIMVVDTPGMFDTGKSHEKIRTEIVKCIGIISPGPHAFLLVIGIGRFTEEEKEAVERLVNCFGEKIYDYFIVLFTRKDDLDYDNKTLQDHLKTIPQPLTDILKKCQNRCIAFNNRAGECESENQAKQLMDMVENNIKANGGRFYTNSDLEAAEKVMKARENEIKREMEEQKKRERDAIVQEIERKFQKIEREKDEKYRKEIDKLKQKDVENELRLWSIENQFSREREYFEREIDRRDRNYKEMQKSLVKQNERLSETRDSEIQQLQTKQNELAQQLMESKNELQQQNLKATLERIKGDKETTQRKLEIEEKRNQDLIQMQHEKEREMQRRIQEQEREYSLRARDQARTEVEKEDPFIIKGLKKVGRVVDNVFLNIPSKAINKAKNCSIS